MADTLALPLDPNDIDDLAPAEGQAPQEDLGEWNESLPDNLQDALKKLAQTVCDEFRYPRRLQVMMAWKARCFWREMQHLNWNWENEAWECIGGVGKTGNGTKSLNNESAVYYSTNLFQGFGESYIAILTQQTPSLRFEPEDPDDAADIQTASKADSLKRLIQHENDPIQLMTKAAYYSWTDGLIAAWTRWADDKRTGKPRETQSCYGAMEVKVPVIADCQDEFVYLQFSNEYHLSQVRAKVRARGFEEGYWKKIKGGSNGNGQDIYERTARISAKQGISMQSAGGDAYSALVTTQRTWFRPEAFMSEGIEEDDREDLLAIFPGGAYVEFDNGVYTGSLEANMDDEWTVEQIMEGDGQFRNAKGTCLISVQERANDIINATQDIYEKTLPASHWDDKMFDINGMKEQRSMPGARYGLNISELQPGDTIAAHVFFEPAAAVSPDMLQYLKELMTDIPEFLTGISAILFGADSGGDKSGKALSIQQSAAMGRIGLPWRVMKRFYAKMMEQAIRCASRNRKDDYKIGVPDSKGRVETIEARIEDMLGSVRCYPDSDENYPESWIAKSNRYMQLLQEGNVDPVMKKIMSAPKNQELGKKLIGLTDFEIPDADSWTKQMMEIDELIHAQPQMQQPPPQHVPNPMMPTVMETVQPPPVQVSSVPIDPDYDNHAAEFETVQDWINSDKGQELKAKAQTDPQAQAGFQNLRLHGLAHKQAMQAAMAAAMPPPPPPPMHKGGMPPHAGAPPHPNAANIAAPPPPAGAAPPIAA